MQSFVVSSTRPRTATPTCLNRLWGVCLAATPGLRKTRRYRFEVVTFDIVGFKMSDSGVPD